MKSTIFLLLLIHFFSSNSFGQYPHITREGTPPPDTLKGLTKEHLKGMWSSNGYTIDHNGRGYYLDSDYEYVSDQKSLYFDDDSLHVLQYPCRYISSGIYSTESWLIVDSQLVDFTGRKYWRDSYDIDRIDQLKQDTINPGCFDGKWDLQRIKSGGDGTGVEYIFPFKINDVLFMDSTVFMPPNLVDDKIFITINGVKRAFHFSLKKKYKQTLTLKPIDDWPKKDKRMWMKEWRTEPLTREELKKIRQTEGIELELTLIKSR